MEILIFLLPSPASCRPPSNITQTIFIPNELMRTDRITFYLLEEKCFYSANLCISITRIAKTGRNC